MYHGEYNYWVYKDQGETRAIYIIGNSFEGEFIVKRKWWWIFILFRKGCLDDRPIF